MVTGGPSLSGDPWGGDQDTSVPDEVLDDFESETYAGEEFYDEEGQPDTGTEIDDSGQAVDTSTDDQFDDYQSDTVDTVDTVDTADEGGDDDYYDDTEEEQQDYSYVDETEETSTVYAGEEFYDPELGTIDVGSGTTQEQIDDLAQTVSISTPNVTTTSVVDDTDYPEDDSWSYYDYEEPDPVVTAPPTSYTGITPGAPTTTVVTVADELEGLSSQEQIALDAAIASEAAALATAAAEAEANLMIDSEGLSSQELIVTDIERASDIFETSGTSALMAAEAAGLVTQASAISILEDHNRELAEAQALEETQALEQQALDDAQREIDIITTFAADNADEIAKGLGSIEGTILQHYNMMVEAGALTRHTNLVDKEGRSGAGRLLATLTAQIYAQRKEDIVQDFNDSISKGEDVTLEKVLRAGVTELELNINYGFREVDIENASTSIKVKDEILYNHPGNLMKAYVQSDLVRDNLGLVYSTDTVQTIETLRPFSDMRGTVDPYEAVLSIQPQAISIDFDIDPVETKGIESSLKQYFQADYVDTLIEVKEYIVQEDGIFNLDEEKFVTENLEKGKEYVTQTLDDLGYENAETFVEYVENKVEWTEAKDDLEDLLEVEDLSEVGDLSQIVTKAVSLDADSEVVLNYATNLAPENVKEQTQELVEGITSLKEHIKTDAPSGTTYIDFREASFAGKTQSELESTGLSKSNAWEVTRWGEAAKRVYAETGLYPDQVSPIQAAQVVGLNDTSVLFDSSDIGWAAITALPHLVDGNFIPEVALSNNYDPEKLEILGVENVDHLVNINDYYDVEEQYYEIHKMHDNPEAVVSLKVLQRDSFDKDENE